MITALSILNRLLKKLSLVGLQKTKIRKTARMIQTKIRKVYPNLEKTVSRTSKLKVE